MALESTQSLTEMSTGNLPRIKGGRRVRLTTSPPAVSRLSRNCGSLTFTDQPASKFKPFVLLIRGFSLSNVTYVWMYMIQDYFWLYAAQFNFIVVHVRNFEDHVQVVDWCAPVRISNSAEYSVLQALQFQEVNVHRILPGGTSIGHNWPNRSFVKRKFNICTYLNVRT
jgi:hypothetical protein